MNLANNLQDVLRAATAIQIAIYELADEPALRNNALPALDKCVAELIERVKVLKKGLR